MASSFDLVVRGGTVVTHERVFRADIGVTRGVVSAVGLDLPHGREEFDATGLHVLPGVIDAHVHFREPGLTNKGGFADGTRAAAAGGVTTVIDMPNTIPPVVSAERFAEKRDLVEPKAHVDFGLYGLFSAESLGHFGDMAAAGAAGLKLYLGKSVGGHVPPDDGIILAGLEEAAAAGLVVGVHAENDHIVDLFTDRLRSAGRHDARAHSESRPELAEVEAVTRIITLASAAHADLHLHHLSTKAALDRVRQLRALGHHLTVEAVIAHLLLDQSAYDTHGNLVKLNPPLRNAADVAALWAGLADGQIDLVATDHAPHTDDEQDEKDVWLAHGGFIGVETSLRLLLTQVSHGRLSLSDVVRITSFAPARRWSLASKGRIDPGADADLAIVDLAARDDIRSETLNSQWTRTPFAGWPVTAAIRRTYLRGQLIATDGQPVGDPTGRMVRPQSAVVPDPVTTGVTA
jgi:dihydroorotase